MTSKLIAFYEGKGSDHRGRTLDEILAWDDDALEYHHDFIQWLFPLREPSPVNPAAPVLTEVDIAEFRARPELRARLRRSFDRMMSFYAFDRPQKHWLTPYNHNFLRLTRVLTSTRLLGLEQESEDLLLKLESLYASHSRTIGPVTLEYWRRTRQVRPSASGAASENPLR